LYQGLNQNPAGELAQARDFLLNGRWDEDAGEQRRQEPQLLNSL
jgi:hypothetical protein